MHIHGYPVALGVLAFVIGASFWRYRKMHRFSAIMFGAAAAMLAIGVVPWLNALAALTASGTGFVVLLLVVIVSGVGFWFEALRKHKHHRIRTPVLSIAFGTAMILLLGNTTRLLLEAGRSPGQTSAAFGTAVARVQSGKAAHATTPHSALLILVIAAAALVLLIIVAGRHEGRGRGGGPLAIGGGGGSSGGSGVARRGR